MKKLLRCMPLLALLVLTGPAVAQQNGGAQSTANPLARLLQSKGIITEQEAATVSQAASPDEGERQLAKLLLTNLIVI